METFASKYQSLTHPAIAVPESYIVFDRGELDTTIVDRFEKQVALYPDNVAVKQGENSYAYLVLNQMANQVAYTILDRLGSYRGPVAFLLEHGFPQIKAIFGILKSGNGYLPLDPEFPQARLVHMLVDSQSPAIITNQQNLKLVQDLAGPGMQIINLDEIDPQTSQDDPGIDIPTNAMMGIYYTSGSTGKPKGCIVTHRNIMHHAMVTTNSRYYHPGDRIIFPMSASYAGSAIAIFGALLNGASLHPYDLRRKGLSTLEETLVEEKITIINLIPPAFRYFAASLDSTSDFPDARLISMGGDTVLKLDVDLFKKHFPETCSLMNTLAGTETLSICSFLISKSTEFSGLTVPVGYQLEDKEILLLDEEGSPVPAGTEGEIVVRSEHLSPGYWRREQISKELFKPVPGKEGTFEYRTGDIGRMDSDGCLYHLGRKDSRVKVRGHRVELAEITSTLFDSPVIKDAHVNAIAGPDGESRLVAYLTPKGETRSPVEDVLEGLKQTLPPYMIPTDIVVMDEIPKTPSGKVDLQNLPAPRKTRASLTSEYLEPRNTLESKLVEIWEKLLDFSPVGVEDDFFELGGHSLSALRLIVEIEEQLGIAVPFPALVRVRTIAGLADLLQDQPALSVWTNLVALQPLGKKHPLFCVPPSGSTGMIFKDLARHLGTERPFYVFQYSGMDEGTEPHKTIPEIARYNLEKVRRLQPDGPYYLGGMCFGGLVAYEMAQQLKTANQEVAFLGVFDSSFPPHRKKNFRINLILLMTIINEKLFNGKLPIGPRGPRERLQRTNIDPAVSGRVLKVFGALSIARLRYTSPPYPGPITLFNTQRRIASQVIERWREATTQHLENLLVPGHHRTQYQEVNSREGTFINEPHVQKLAALVNASLEQADSRVETAQ